MFLNAAIVVGLILLAAIAMAVTKLAWKTWRAEIDDDLLNRMFPNKTPVMNDLGGPALPFDNIMQGGESSISARFLTALELLTIALSERTKPINLLGVQEALEKIGGTLAEATDAYCFMVNEQGPKSSDPADEVFDKSCLRLGNGHWFARSWSDKGHTMTGGLLIHKKEDGTYCQGRLQFFECRQNAGLHVDKIRLECRTPLTCHGLTCVCGKSGSIIKSRWEEGA